MVEQQTPAPVIVPHGGGVRSIRRFIERNAPARFEFPRKYHRASRVSQVKWQLIGRGYDVLDYTTVEELDDPGRKHLPGEDPYTLVVVPPSSQPT